MLSYATSTLFNRLHFSAVSSLFMQLLHASYFSVHFMTYNVDESHASQLVYIIFDPPLKIFQPSLYFLLNICITSVCWIFLLSFGDVPFSSLLYVPYTSQHINSIWQRCTHMTVQYQDCIYNIFFRLQPTWYLSSPLTYVDIQLPFVSVKSEKENFPVKKKRQNAFF